MKNFPLTIKCKRGKSFTESERFNIEFNLRLLLFKRINKGWRDGMYCPALKIKIAPVDIVRLFVVLRSHNDTIISVTTDDSFLKKIIQSIPKDKHIFGHDGKDLTENISSLAVIKSIEHGSLLTAPMRVFSGTLYDLSCKPKAYMKKYAYLRDKNFLKIDEIASK